MAESSGAAYPDLQFRIKSSRQAANLTGSRKRNDVEQRQKKSYPSARGKSNLKLVASGAEKSKRLRAGGLEPSESMVPEQYVAMCEGGTITMKGKTTIAVLEFRVIDGPHGGTALRHWITIPDVDGVVPIASRYGRQCAIALGREIESGDDLDPAAVFKGKFFLIDVGFRMTEKIGGTATKDNALRRKDGRDFLRVHSILALQEELL
jgi:hypothetical protein